MALLTHDGFILYLMISKFQEFITEEAKWVNFIEQQRKVGAVTDIFSVVNKENGSQLGTVKWFGRWRKYAFFPNNDCVFECDCMLDIAAFLKKLMDKRKAK